MEFKVVKSNRKSMAIEIKGKEMIIRAPLQATNEQINSFMLQNKAWIEKHLGEARKKTAEKADIKKLTPEELQTLADRALEVIPERVRHFAPLVGVTYGKITIRDQHTKWGSCSTAGNLNFNCLLMLAPPAVLDSVVVHELCHRKEMNHSDKFYAEVLRVFPDYWEQHKWLKENGEILMAMLP